MDSKSSLAIFNAHYCEITEDLRSNYSAEASKNPALEKVFDHFTNVVDYNVSGGKKLRGTFVLDAVRILFPEQTPESLKQAAVLGWCIELMQGAFLVADDLMDHSITRRGKPCWYLTLKEKETCVNDSFYLYSCTFTLLNKHFPTNVKLYHLFNEVFQRTVIGQGLDLETPSILPTIDMYTQSHYETIVRWKTAYYTIALPILCGVLISPFSFLADHPDLMSIALDIGVYFQAQDDFLDCYGNPDIIGKIGTDIQERKCSWLIVRAFELLDMDDHRREILRDNYGYDDSVKVQRVKDIYNELHLEEHYATYERNAYDSIKHRITQANFGSAQIEALLMYVLDNIHHRRK